MISTTFSDAMIAAQQGKIHAWVLSFLKTSGNNSGLADTLEKEGVYHLGPIAYPLKDLVNIIGPDDSYKYQEPKDVLDAKVATMIRDLRKGWKPPPLIATNFWEDYWEIADGGHRHRALQKLKIATYPTIFYFRDKATFEHFQDKISQHPQVYLESNVTGL